MWRNPHQATSGPMWQSMWGSETDPVLSAGGVYLANAATGLLLPGFAYTRSGPDLWCPQADGSLASFAANVIPREWANGRWGFRFDPGWKNFWLSRGGGVGGSFTDGTFTDASGLPCSKFTPNAGAQNFPRFGISPEAFTASSGQTVDIALSGYIYPSVPGAVSLEPYIVVEINTSPAANPSYTTLQIASANGTVQSKSLGVGVTEKQPLTIITVGNGYKFEWLLTYTQGATIRNQVLANVQARTTAGIGSYTADGVAAIQYSMLSASLSSYIVPSTIALTSAATVGNHSCSALMSALGISLGSEYTNGVEYTSATTATDKVVLGLSSGAFANSIYVIPRNGAGSQSFSMLSGNVPQLEAMSGAAAAVGALQKSSLRAKQNDSRASINGALLSQDAACVLPVGLTNIRLGGAPWGGAANDFAGHIHKLWLAPTRALTDTELQALTS